MHKSELTFSQIRELKKFTVGQQFEPMIYLDVAERLLALGMVERTVGGGYVLSAIGQGVARM